MISAADGGGADGVVLYLDDIFFFNFAMDGLVMYLTALWGGLAIRGGRIVLAAGLGGLYSIFCLLPAFSAISCLVMKCAVAMFMIRIAFGGGKHYFRLVFFFVILACMLGGAMVSLSQRSAISNSDDILIHIDWKVFFLVTVVCCFLLSIVFRGDASHDIKRQLKRGYLELSGRRVEMTMLLDTGNTLTDQLLNCPVMVAEKSVLETLWTRGEGAILSRLEEQGAEVSLIRLNDICPGKFRLIPYRAVGVRSGFLVAFQADALVVDETVYRKVLVAISPTPLSEHGEYSALWGVAEEKREVRCAA